MLVQILDLLKMLMQLSTQYACDIATHTFMYNVAMLLLQKRLLLHNHAKM